MGKVSGAAAVVGAMILVPTAAFAQRAGGGMADAPQHEFGVDVALAYSSVSGGNGVFSLATPVDVRVGFVSATKLSWEGRLGLAFTSTSGSTAYSLSPDVNVLYELGAGTGAHSMMGPYLTGGLGLGIISFGSSNSGVNFTVNAGVGTRIQAGSGGAWRFEGFLAYTPKNTTIGPFGNMFSIGARVGLSLWH
jgi:hypothetical protein